MSNIRNIPFARPWITDHDKNAVMEVLNGHILTHGPEGKAFEAEFTTFLGQEEVYCISVSSCMAALHLAYLHFGIGFGDEVIVPAQTHTATVHAVEWVGAKPVFVDCDLTTGNMTCEGISAAITSRTKAISVVHFLGIPCHMSEIMSLAERHGLKVIEDCAIALGTRYQGKHVGLFGDAGCFSFYPAKHITTGEGGMFVTRHRTVAESVNKLRAFGVDRNYTERTIPGMYDVPALGLNYRMSEIQAALGRSQLRRIDENLKRRQANFMTLKRMLNASPEIYILDSISPDAQSSHYCLSLVLKANHKDRRNKIVTSLNAAGVGTSIYYPQPVPRMGYYRSKYGYEPERFTHAGEISDRSVALPVGPHVNTEDIDYMAAALKHSLEEVS